MSKMIVFSKPGEVELWDVPTPEVGPGQILLETIYSSISAGTELQVLGGHLPLIQRGEINYPLVPGYENVGRVLEVGDGVSGFRPGD